MKRLLVPFVLSTLALSACSGGDDSQTVCEDFDWGESCVTVHREFESGVYVGGTAEFDQYLNDEASADESYGFKRAEVYITWECGNDPELKWMRLDGMPAGDDEFSLDDHYASVEWVNECDDTN